jgi:hypothetical protein
MTWETSVGGAVSRVLQLGSNLAHKAGELATSEGARHAGERVAGAGAGYMAADAGGRVAEAAMTRHGVPAMTAWAADAGAKMVAGTGIAIGGKAAEARTTGVVADGARVAQGLGTGVALNGGQQAAELIAPVAEQDTARLTGAAVTFTARAADTARTIFGGAIAGARHALEQRSAATAAPATTTVIKDAGAPAPIAAVAADATAAADAAH